LDTLDTYDVDFQYHFTVGDRNNLVWGLGYRYTHESDEDLSIVRFSPDDLGQSLYNAFLQDEIALTKDVRLTLGSKLEHNGYTGFEAEPSGRLQWNFAPTQMVWAAVSRAVRTPSRYDRDLEVVSGLQNAPAPYQFPVDYLDGSSDFVSETEIAYELGYRAQISTKVSVSISAYYNSYDDVRSTTATSTSALYPFPFPIYFQNNLEGHTYGVEVASNYELLPWWRVHFGYDLLRENIHAKPGETDATGALNETADPEQQFSVRSSMDLTHHVNFDAALRWVDSLTLDNGPTSGPTAGDVPSYYELNARVAWQATSRLELSIVGDNLLHPRHVEYGYPSAAREEIARSVFGKAEWRF
jgi:iron complex outermembrane receptor protein